MRIPLIQIVALIGMLSAGTVVLAAPTTAAVRTEAAATATEAAVCPLYQAELERARHFLDAMIKTGVQMPQPVDPGGGASHEQHKRNYQAVMLGAQLHAATGEARYAAFARDLLLAYAEMYPALGKHPAHGNQEPGRLFWQNLNDSVWLVHVARGYKLLRETLSASERERIETRVLRPAALFLAEGSPRLLGRIHNHATWGAAAVGMTGYVLNDRHLIDLALLGPRKDGKAGFLRQIDLLFSPDGYYSEGPYYQRFALLPFLVFADVIERNEPQRKVFARRDGVLVRALNTTIDLSYGGYFLPINDALKDKSLRTAELYEAVALVYAHNGDRRLLDIARMQGRTVLDERGRAVACALQAGQAEPFQFGSRLVRDGAEGDQGALVLLRHGNQARDTLLVAKNTSQGMGHGHFDKLNWLFFDNGAEVLRDYGAARFLNIEAKRGGIYLPQNNSWAKQTIAHNTLVVDQQSHFGGKLGVAEQSAPKQLHYRDDPQLQLSIARIDDAYPDARITRNLALLPIPGLQHPVVVDLLEVQSRNEHLLDLPLHYQGHIMRVGAALESYPAQRPVLGKSNGYQHLWLDAKAQPSADQAFVTWLLGERFYTWRWLPQPNAELLLAESGANDPEFNLRREPVLIQRVRAKGSTRFVGVLESHGKYDGASEQTVASNSQIHRVAQFSEGDLHLVEIETVSGARTVLALAPDSSPTQAHRLNWASQNYSWTGAAARFDFRPSTEEGHER